MILSQTSEKSIKMPDPIIKIKDKRTIDPLTGGLVSDKRRMHGQVKYSHLKNIVESATKYGIDPYTALAINLQESGFKDEFATNPFRLDPSAIDMDTYEELRANPVSGSMRYMKDKFEYAKKLGKTTEEDIIQAWNGYGKIGGKGKGMAKAYGIDVSQEPIDMKKNPVYAKRIINLRDSVIKQNPDVIKYIEEATRMKQISKQMDKPSDMKTGGLKCGGKKLKCGGKKMEEGGLKGEKFNKTGGDIAEMIADILPGVLSSMAPEYTDIRENPAETMEKQASLGVAGSVAGSTLKGAAKGLATAGPVGALIGGGAGLLTSGLGAIFGAKKRRQERRDASEKWSNNWAGSYADAYSSSGYKEGGKIEKVMHEFKTGKLHSGSKKGPLVTNRKQAIAIALSEAGKSKYETGGEVEGPGTEKSDSITKKVTDGSFIVPAENAKYARQLGEEYLGWDGNEKARKDYSGSEVKLSDGEVLFTPEEVSMLEYHGIDLNKLAPKAENKIEPGAKLANGTDNDPESYNYRNRGNMLDEYMNPVDIGNLSVSGLNNKSGELIETNNPYTGGDPAENTEEPPTLLERITGFMPTLAGMIQTGAGIAGMQKAGRMPDINISTHLKELAAEQRKEAEYGLEPGAKSAMKIANERERRNATNALVSRGGGAGELFSNLQGIMNTAINASYQTELHDAAEKARKKSEYARTKMEIGAQDMDVQRINQQNWKELMGINADLLNAGISNIVGARKLKAEMDALKEIEKNRKINFTIG